MFCRNCGFQMPDGAGFCTNCGAALTASEPAPAPAPAAQPAPAPVAQPAPAPVEQPAPAPAPQKKSSKAALWIILGVLLAAGVTVAILWYTGAFEEDKKTGGSMPVAPYAGNVGDPSGDGTNQPGLTLPGLMDGTQMDATTTTTESPSAPTTTVTKKPTTTTSTTKKPTTTTINKPTQAAPVLSSDNPYADVYVAGRVYVFADSASRKLTSADLAGMTLEQLCIARNEIYARHGYVFSDKNLLEYFQQFSWYHPKGKAGDLSSLSLSATEIANVDILKAKENALKNGEEDSGTYTVSNGKIQVSIPEVWNDVAVIETDPDRLSFYEAISNDEGWGGHLVTIALYSDLGYQNIPKIRTLGELTDEDGDHWYVAAWFPTDVQFSETGAANYAAMEEEIDAILASLEACKGYFFEAY